MLSRTFLLLLGLFLAWMWLARALKTRVYRGRRPSPDAPGKSEGMVRDRVCNTFLPRSSALVLREGAQELFFCSEACRKEYRRAHPEAARPVA